MKNQTYIFHVDLDAFFVSVERLLDPKLIGKPVIVGGDPKSRGVVAAASYEARKYGIHSAMPLIQAYNLCRHAIFVSGSHGKYSEYSKRVKEILARYAPKMEMTSIDEGYLDFTGCERLYKNILAFASTLQKTIKQETGLPISIGIGSNKMIAKVASDASKPEGILAVMPGYERDFLAPLRVEVIPGVGKVTLQNLHSYGINYVGELAMFDKAVLREIFGVAGETLYNYAHGFGDDKFYEPRQRKSMSKAITFPKDIADKNLVDRYMLGIIESICFELRKKQLRGRTISIKVRYSDFKDAQRSQTLLSPTNDDIVIYDVASKLFKKAVTRRLSIRLISVEISNFCEDIEQPEIFTFEKDKWEKVFASEQKIRTKYGKNIIGFANSFGMKRKSINPS